MELLVENGADVDIQNVSYSHERESSNSRTGTGPASYSNVFYFSKRKRLYRGEKACLIFMVSRVHTRSIAKLHTGKASMHCTLALPTKMSASMHCTLVLPAKMSASQIFEIFHFQAESEDSRCVENFKIVSHLAYRGGS